MSNPVLSATFANGSTAIQLGQTRAQSQMPVGSQVFLFPIGPQGNPGNNGAPPTPFQLNTPYYLLTNNVNGLITIAATVGGAAITATQTGVCGLAWAIVIGYETNGNAIFGQRNKHQTPKNVPMPFQTYQAQSFSIGENGTGGTVGPSQIAAPPGNAPATVARPINPH